VNVLIGCERSGVIRRAFRSRGHNAWSCDLVPADDGSPHHIQGDVLDEIGYPHWDLLIVHPDCTYLSVSGLHWNKRVPGRAEKTEAALEFVRILMNTEAYANGRDVPLRFCLENPISCISSRIRKPDQIVQPYQFGHDASKATCLWLKNLPLLVPTKNVAPRMVNGRPRWANQTDSGQNRLGPSPTRAADRSRTYEGIADAMAEQWGIL
jgi:hypothetical protein